MLTSLIFSQAFAGTAVVHVSNAQLAITADHSGIVIAGDVDASEHCEGCSVIVVHDNPKLSDIGFVGEGVVTRGGVALLTSGLEALHIGQAGIWGGELLSDEDFDKFLDSPDDDIPVFWLDAGSGAEMFALTSDLSAYGALSLEDLYGVLPAKLEEGRAVAVSAAALEIGDLHKSELIALDPLELTFDSPIDPAIMEKAIQSMWE